MNPLQKRTMYVLCALTAFVTCVVYAATLTQVHTFDALSYILDVSRKPWQQLFHPHHLAYGPFGAIMSALVTGVDVATALQCANAVAGSLGSAVFCAIVYRRWQRIDIALLATGSLAFSYAYWYYAVEVEVYTLATLCVMWILWLIMEPQPSRLRWQLSLALGMAGAVLFHQTNALLALPLLVRAWPALRVPGNDRRGWVFAGAGAFLIVVSAYAWVMVGVSGFDTYASAHQWLFDYVDSGWWGGKATLWDLLTGLSDTIAAGWGGWIGIALICLTASTVVYQRIRVQNVWLLVWFVTYAGFFGWWEPDNIEFWIGITPVVVLLVMSGFAQLHRTDVRLLLAYVIVFSTFLVNLSAIRLRGDATTDLQRRIAQAVRASSQPADLLLVPDGLQELYLPYYEQREHFLSVNAAIVSAGSWANACVTLQQAIAQTHQAGGQVIIADDFLIPSPTMQARYGLAGDAVTTCLSAIQPLLEPVRVPTDVPDQQMLPTAGILLQRGALAMLGGAPLGWTANNATSLPATVGWQVQVDRDPVLVSPILDVPMPRRLVIDLAATDTADVYGQLFVATAPNQFDEAHALSWELTGQRQRITLDLTLIADLPSRLIQLRIDPVADGAGGTVIIYGISLE